VNSVERTIVAISVALLLMAGCSSAANAFQCATDETPQVVYRPPMDAVWAAASSFQPSHDHKFTGTPTPATEYRTYAGAMAEIATDGTPTFVRFPLGTEPYASTGNRTVDKAIQAWAMQFRFSPDTCIQARIRTAPIIVDLRK
jgi:hypothetical protein